ncbi:16S rRNA (cytosine(1402)-N(4))-methyltransferase RsmH [Pseudogracilibacillus sp. SE30717A]|uniref:16S rRNA (cytosine(1402)-N(4))-methyltransferase RsmH n=1 Tax=Pseudogracilibacillus sp. SE30717A TaxID=3098293 RepID=UPI00300DD048
MNTHESVLKDEAIQSLNIRAEGTYIDCTLGRAGHAGAIVSLLNDNGRLIGFDQDEDAIEEAKRKLPKEKSILIHANFKNLQTELKNREIHQIDGILFDLGVSSPQLDQGERGFSYQQNAKLDMRMDHRNPLTAYEIVNSWPYEQLVKIFYIYGEEKFSKQIARNIERYRASQKIETTYELVDLIKEAIPAPARRTGGHPAKRVFQALRIAVNDELDSFNDALHQASKVLSIGGRISVITFHSLEDRLCKLAFQKWSTEKPMPRGLPIIPAEFKAPFKRITRKPIIPRQEEITRNRRARSAKLRVVEKVKEWDEEFKYMEGWKK